MRFLQLYHFYRCVQKVSCVCDFGENKRLFQEGEDAFTESESADVPGVEGSVR